MNIFLFAPWLVVILTFKVLNLWLDGVLIILKGISKYRLYPVLIGASIGHCVFLCIKLIF